jgi:hypothetical protein
MVNPAKVNPGEVKMNNPLSYVSAPVPDDCVFKFSPSQFANFISYPHNWYRTQVLMEDVFSHNTASAIGTIVHYCAEQVAKEEDVDKKSIDAYIQSLEVTPEYNRLIVESQYVAMAETLVNDYVLNNEYLEVETSHCAQIKPGYYAAGTLDAIQGTKEDCMIVDYKTYSSKTKPKTIPAYYKYQLLVYCWILIQNGYTPKRIRLVYVNRNIEGEFSPTGNGKRLKSYPPEVTVLTETITQEDIEFIEGLMHLAVDSLEATKKHPELTHVIWHDMRLKV